MSNIFISVDALNLLSNNYLMYLPLIDECIKFSCTEILLLGYFILTMLTITAQTQCFKRTIENKLMF